MGALALLCSGCSVLVVSQAGAQHAQGIGALGIGLLRQQHASHIGVLDNIYRG